MTPQSPGEVLEAVRRLEADLEVMRARARDRERDVIDLQATIAEDAARERQALVEDMARLVDLIGTSWRATHDQIAELTGEVRSLRQPHFVFRPEGPVCFAGLMSLWKLEGQLPVINCAILTREAPAPLSAIPLTAGRCGWSSSPAAASDLAGALS